MNGVLTERKFVLEASRQRVWDLLGRAIIDSLEMERFHARDDLNFDAITRVKVAFVSLAMQVSGKMEDISPPSALSVLLRVKGMGGIIQSSQKATFKLNAIDKDKTEMICQVSGDKVGFPLGILLVPKVKSFSRELLEKIEKRLRRIA